MESHFNENGLIGLRVNSRTTLENKGGEQFKNHWNYHWAGCKT